MAPAAPAAAPAGDHPPTTALKDAGAPLPKCLLQAARRANMEIRGCYSWCGQQPSLALRAQQYPFAGVTCELTVLSLGSPPAVGQPGQPAAC